MTEERRETMRKEDGDDTMNAIIAKNKNNNDCVIPIKKKLLL